MDRIFLDILNLSIAGSWLILAVLLLRPLMKKAPRSIVCALWLVVGLRLMLPFSIESALSLIPSRETLNPEILEPGMVSAAMPALESGARFIDSGVELIDRAVNPVISQSVAPRPEYSVNPMQALSFIAGCVWLMGFALMVGYSISSYIRLRLRMRETVPVEKNVRQGSAVESPFVLGLFSPRIYLPAGLSEKDRPLVLAHERAHIRRGDNFIKPLGFLLLAVHWFNPLVWLGYILLCRDIESACDERVVKELGSDIRRDYSMALLNCSCGRRAISACPLAFGEISVKSRIKGVLNYKKPSFWITLLALLGCAVLAVCFLTDPEPKQPELQGKWSSPLDFSNLEFLEDGTVNAYDDRGPVNFTVEGSNVTLHYEDEPLTLERRIYNDVEHLVNNAAGIDLVRSEDCGIVPVELTDENWQDYFQLVKRPWYINSSYGKLDKLGYDILLVPTPEYAQRIVPESDPEVTVSLSMVFNKASDERIQIDDGSRSFTYLGQTALDSIAFPEGKKEVHGRVIRQKDLGDSLYKRQEPGLVVQQEQASNRYFDGYWTLTLLDEPDMIRFSGTLYTYEKPILPEPGTSPALLPLDTPTADLFTDPAAEVTVAGPVGELLFIIPPEGEGEDYAPSLLTELENSMYVDSRMAESLSRMLADCNAAGHQVEVFRAYEPYGSRRYELGEEPGGMTDEEYSQWLRSPLKRELQTGLSVMLARYSNGDFYDSTAERYTQEVQRREWDDTLDWLLRHCADYGFIQRFPSGKEDITGGNTATLFRYVDSTAAQYMARNGLCLEEHIASASAQNGSTDGSAEDTQPLALDSSLFFVVPAAGEGADYVPAQLSQIRPDDHESGPLYLDARAADSLNAMLEDCRAAGHKVELFRAYESYEEGVAMYLEQYPDDRELTHFADLSYGWYRAPLKRDLQSGLSVMLADTAQGLGYPLSEENGFDETEAWLDGHCTDYGFVLRFPQEKMNLTGKGGPSGMYRYVGREMAEYMAENNLCLEEFMLLNGLETPSTDLGQFEMEVLGAYSVADDYLCYVKFSPIEPEHLKNGALRINAIHTVSDSRLALIPAGTQLDGTASYDEAGKTLTVCFYAANYREELGESWPLDVEVKMALYGNPLASPGSLSFPAPETESRQLMLDEPLEFSVEGLENPIRLMGVELRPCAVAALMEWQDSERFFHPGTDFSLLSDEDKEWISKVNTSFTQASLQCSSMGIRFADGSSMNTSAGRYGPRFEDGLLMQWSYEFPQPIDLDAVASVTLGGKTVEIS